MKLNFSQGKFRKFVIGCEQKKLKFLARKCRDFFFFKIIHSSSLNRHIPCTNPSLIHIAQLMYSIYIHRNHRLPYTIWFMKMKFQLKLPILMPLSATSPTISSYTTNSYSYIHIYIYRNLINSITFFIHSPCMLFGSSNISEYRPQISSRSLYSRNCIQIILHIFIHSIPFAAYTFIFC